MVQRTREIVSVQDRDAGFHDGVVFPVHRVSTCSLMRPLRSEPGLHITHRDHVVDFLDTEPMQHVRHQRLETHILDSGNEFRRLEVLVCRVTAAFTEVIHEVPDRFILDEGRFVGQ